MLCLTHSTGCWTRSADTACRVPPRCPSPSCCSTAAAALLVFDVVHRSICSIVDARIAQRRDHDEEDSGTYLDQLISAHLLEPSRLTLAEVRANAMTIVFAGHEMTTNTLSWCVYFLGLHPQLQDEARAEVESAVASTSQHAQQQQPDTSAYSKEALPLLQAIITESMRLIPSVGFLSRRTAADVWLCEGKAAQLFVPRNTLLTFSSYSMLRDPAVYGADAADFRPQRFLPPNPTPPPRAMFGTGPRGCVGQSYAELQMRVVLATLLRHRRWLLDGSYSHHPLHAVTTRPKYGVPVRVWSAACGVVVG